jgi:predicted component of type VI protein secretion system
MRNTIRKVTIVVPVLITSCQVSEKLKSGPVTAHATMIATAKVNTQARPASRDVTVAICENSLLIRVAHPWDREPQTVL